MAFEIDHNASGRDENGMFRFVHWFPVEVAALVARRQLANEAEVQMTDGPLTESTASPQPAAQTFFKQWL